MLRSTFLHVPGVGRKTEKNFWNQGMKTWNDFLGEYKKLGMKRRERIKRYVERSISSCKKKNYGFLIRTMPPNTHWRAYKELEGEKRCCFLDIETTGLSKVRNKITMIGMFDGREERIFVKGKNLGDFESAIKDYSLVVTFNGKRFDLPFIKEKFPGARMNFFHVDLMYELWKLGYRGGLKKIEKLLGISRSEEVEGMSGYEAVLLWKKYKRGDKKALKLLMDYNKEDVKNLKILMEFAYKDLKGKIGSDFF